MRLSAAVGGPVAALLVCLLSADVSDCVLAVPARTMAAEACHDSSFLLISCAVSVLYDLRCSSEPCQ